MTKLIFAIQKLCKFCNGSIHFQNFVNDPPILALKQKNWLYGRDLVEKWVWFWGFGFILIWVYLSSQWRTNFHDHRNQISVKFSLYGEKYKYSWFPVVPVQVFWFWILIILTIIVISWVTTSLHVLKWIIDSSKIVL